jgi:hypothetical protein
MQETLALGVRHPLGCSCPACAAAMAALTGAAVALPGAATDTRPADGSPDGDNRAATPVNAVGVSRVEQLAPAFGAPDAFDGWAPSVITDSPAAAASFQAEEPNASADAGVSQDREMSQGRDLAAWMNQRIAFTGPGVLTARNDSVVAESDSTGLSPANESPALEK